MEILGQCSECGALIIQDQAEAEDDPLCLDCMVAQLAGDAGELDDDELVGDAEPLTAPKGWGPPPMGSAKRPRPSEVNPERSEP
jgi:hypothetical protein